MTMIGEANRRVLVAGLAASWLAMAAAAFGSARAADTYGPKAADAKPGGTLTVGSLIEPPSLDPFHQGAEARIRFTVLIYQGLFYEGADGEAVPLLAESYELSPDRLTYTIKLRGGVKFHTGAAMTAKDVAYSYNYIRDARNGSPGAGDFASIKSIDIVDDATIRITLALPNASLPMTLGNKYGAVVPAGYFDAPDAKVKLNQASVGTGPFKLAEFKPNSNLTLARHTEYWEKGTPYLDGIQVAFLPNAASMLVGLTSKRLDLALVVRPQDLRQVERVPGLKTERWPSLNQKSIDLGLEYAPLADERIRRAIALAIDKEEMMKASIGGYGKTIGTMVTAMQERWGLPADQVPNGKPDVETAGKLVAEAGHPNGLDITLTTINGYEWMEPASVTLREQLARANIRMAIQKVDLGVWIKNFQSKQMGFTFNDWASQPDPNLLFYRHFHAAPEGADFRNWKDAEASRLLDEGRAESDPAKRKAIYGAFQKRMAESVPTIMLFSADILSVRAEKVRNYVQHPTGWFFGLARTHLAP
jgi:peptide/nickel transport system substrate-binding protein